MQQPPAFSTRCADSLVGSLCREIAAVRQGWQQLHLLRSQCREDRLLRRLQREAQRLEARRRELQGLARLILRLPLRDPLAAALLLELTSRPLPA